jgi:hypothetical protein
MPKDEMKDKSAPSELLLRCEQSIRMQEQLKDVNLSKKERQELFHSYKTFIGGLLEDFKHRDPTTSDSREPFRSYLIALLPYLNNPITPAYFRGSSRKLKKIKSEDEKKRKFEQKKPLFRVLIPKLKRVKYFEQLKFMNEKEDFERQLAIEMETALIMTISKYIKLRLKMLFGGTIESQEQFMNLQKRIHEYEIAAIALYQILEYSKKLS